MHIKQNLAAFRRCFKDGIPQPLLFVDFGCGPMTAGLALAQILSRETPDYKNQTSYIGVDVSQNMVDKAEFINREHQPFAPERFKVVRNAQLTRQILSHSPPGPVTAVLCLSFVLAPRTLKSDTQKGNFAESLADTWKTGINNQPECRETKIIYLNPLPDHFHKRWRVFKSVMLAPDAAGKFCYISTEFTQLSVDSLSNKIHYEMICGTPK